MFQIIPAPKSNATNVNGLKTFDVLPIHRKQKCNWYRIGSPISIWWIWLLGNNRPQRAEMKRHSLILTFCQKILSSQGPLYPGCWFLKQISLSLLLFWGSDCIKRSHRKLSRTKPQQYSWFMAALSPNYLSAYRLMQPLAQSVDSPLL